MTSGAVTADARACVLADGSQMPMLGLGVWQAPNGPERVNAVRWALDLGYRHIDTAQAYGNEESLVRALRRLPRVMCRGRLVCAASEMARPLRIRGSTGRRWRARPRRGSGPPAGSVR